jgi:hypothetical protein
MAMAGTPRLTAVRTVAQLFYVLGGVQGVVEITGCRKTTVDNWLHLYDRLPAKTYLILQGALKSRGHIGDPKLWKML